MRIWASRAVAALTSALLLLGGAQAANAGVGQGERPLPAAQAATPHQSHHTAVIALYRDPEGGKWRDVTLHPPRGMVKNTASTARALGADVIVGDFSTKKSTAYFWSGLGSGGEDLAGKIATRRGGVTLGMLLEKRNIEMPAWDGSERVELAWSAVSEEYARQASGTVHVILGAHVRPNAIWYTEFENLKRNRNVTKVVSVDPDSDKEKTIHTRQD
ncbi:MULTISPECIES: hypothetical protein [unclassified Streptomyces]|uniref:hypothetical protein n=1 Tax=Streptomyces sp. SYP-A7185 TaxID=3040076 RepID=UPI0038F80F91